MKGVDTELLAEIRVSAVIHRLESNMLWEQRATALGVKIGTPYPSIESKQV